MNFMQVLATNGVNSNATAQEISKPRKEVMPKNCSSFSKFKKEFFRRLKQRYEKIQVDHS